jgi:hypothetical protein
MDLKSFIAGFVLALILVWLWGFLGAKSSYYEPGTFKPDMSMTNAIEAYETAKRDIESKYTQLISSAEASSADAAPLRDQAVAEMAALSSAFNDWAAAQAPVAEASPAPAPESAV